jgi:type IV fimbrial biogenesis protein FimT
MPGFTLVELLVTIAIAAIVVTLAVPGMAAMVRNAQLSGNANQLVTALHLARSEAVKRGQRVVVRRVLADSDWEAGWRVFVDSDRDDIFDGGETVLREYGPLSAGYTLRGDERDGVNFDDFIRYEPSGRSNNTTEGRFALCSNAAGGDPPQANTARLILVNRLGRVRVAGDSDSNGVPEKDDGANMASCTVSPF